MTSVRSLLKIPGARKAAMPAFIEPCHAMTAARVPSGENWSHEIKLDGYRVQAHIAARKATLFTRRGFDWTSRFTAIAAELAVIGVRNAILDGEVIVADEAGRSNFHRLQMDLAKGRSDRLLYAVFDLLFVDGVDLRGAALADRRTLLREIFTKRNHERVIFSEEIGVSSADLLKHVCAMKLEGIVSKRIDAPYRSGRHETWLKIKCHLTDDFPIVAFVEKLGAKPRRIASLYLGRFDDGRLLYAGKAQTGFRAEDQYLLRERLDPYITSTSPLTVPVKKPKATWVQPQLQAEIEYSAFTADGLLRAPVYKGLRDDLAPLSSKSDGGAAQTEAKPSAVPRANILHLLPDAFVPAASELKTYWERVHRLALPYLGRRPLKLVRSVSGTTFYHKGRLPKIPAAVHQLRVIKREGGEGVRVWIDDLEGLLGLVDMNVIELHPWNAKVDDIERADVMVFDLDPGPDVSWAFVIDTAFTLRELLEQHGFEQSWPKLTGGKGLHVMVPLEDRTMHDDAHRQSRAIAERLTRLDPDRYTISAALSARRGRLFVDYLRNGRGTTAVGAYSPRARAPGTIAAPVEWQALERGALRSDHYTIDAPPTRRTGDSPRVARK